MLERMPGETALQHHKRLVEGKLVDKTLADYDYSELAPYVYGQDFSADVARRMMYGSARTIQLMDADGIDAKTNDGLLNELEAKKIELQKERQRFFDQRTEFNRAVREQAREDELKDLIENAIKNGNLPRLEYEPFDDKPSETDLVVSLSDVHYGAAHDNYWGKFDPDICRQMFRKYIAEITEIAKTHLSRNCYVTANGDLISGSAHMSIRLTNRENIIKQVTGVSELIAEFLYELSFIFNHVYFSSVAGNHSRLDKKDDALISERLDDLIEWYLGARLSAIQNVHIGAYEKIDPTMCMINVRGHNMLTVHGDYEPSMANLANLQAMVGRPLHAILMGHRHHNAMDICQGIRIIQSGSFLGTDDYCISKRLFGRPEQIVCVVDDGGIRCAYNVGLDVDGSSCVVDKCGTKAGGTKAGELS